MSDHLAAVEAILFVAESPVPIQEMAQVLEAAPAEIETALELLGKTLAERRSGLVVRESGGGWRLYSRPDLKPYLERFATSSTATRLSKASLETLAVIAYRQPVARSQVSEIRGVDSDHAIRTLERRGLVDVVGTAPGAGQAALFGTTDLFLEKLGLRNLDELPPLADHIPPSEVVDDLERPMRPESSSSDSRS